MMKIEVVSEWVKDPAPYDYMGTVVQSVIIDGEVAQRYLGDGALAHVSGFLDGLKYAGNEMQVTYTARTKSRNGSYHTETLESR